MSIVKEFKEFAVKGNVMDMAVGVIIGGAFGKIIAALIEDLIMPVVGKVVGNVDFSNLYLSLSANVSAAAGAGPLSLAEAKKLGPVFAYGNFISVTINFFVLALCVFLMVKAMNNLKKKTPVIPPAPTEKNCPLCHMVIPLAAKKCGHCTSAV